jgi:hypothetical protein
MSNWIKIAIVIIATALLTAGISKWLSGSSQTKVSISVESIRALSYLTTTEYTLSAMVEKSYKSDMIFKDVTSDHAIAVVRGKVKGSVDLENAIITIHRKTRNEAGNDSVSIHFPRGSMHVSGVEVEESRVFSCRGVTLTNLVTKGASDNQKNELARVAREEIKKSAINTDIVNRTMDNAKNALCGFVGSFGFIVNITWDEKVYDPA